MTLSKKIVDAIEISRIIVEKDIDFEEGDGRNNRKKLNLYRREARPRINIFRMDYRASPNQVLDGLVVQHLEGLSDEKYVHKRSGFPFWGNGYVWPNVWAAASEPGVTGQTDVRYMPQLIILAGYESGAIEKQFGLEVGLAHGWYMKEWDARITKMRKREVFDQVFRDWSPLPGYDFTYPCQSVRMPENLTNGYKEYMRNNWKKDPNYYIGVPRITRWIPQEEIGHDIGDIIREIFENLYPLLHGICHLADEQMADAGTYLALARKSKDRKVRIDYLEKAFQLEPGNIQVLQMLGDNLLSDPLRVGQARKLLQRAKELRRIS